MRQIAATLFALLIAAAPLAAETIVVPGEPIGYGLPPGFVIRAAGVDFNDDFTYIWVDAEGNCRWDYRQECWTGNNGQVHCRTIREWRCDTASTAYRLPPQFTVDTGAKRAYYSSEDGSFAYGKVKSFLWSQWISLFEGADLQVNYEGAAIALDPEVLGESLQKDQFQELHQDAE